MRITVKRAYKKPNYTIGKMYIDGVYFCDTLEDAVRELGKDGKGKIPNETAIPAGTYQVVVTQSPKFKRLLPAILGVLFFEGIRIHAGNTAKDTSGCILVGRNTSVGRLSESRKYENELTSLIQQATANKQRIYITIEN